MRLLVGRERVSEPTSDVLKPDEVTVTVGLREVWHSFAMLTHRDTRRFAPTRHQQGRRLQPAQELVRGSGTCAANPPKGDPKGRKDPLALVDDLAGLPDDDVEKIKAAT